MIDKNHIGKIVKIKIVRHPVDIIDVEPHILQNFKDRIAEDAKRAFLKAEKQYLSLVVDNKKPSHDKCIHCDSKNFAEIEKDSFECHDCGEMFWTGSTKEIPF